MGAAALASLISSADDFLLRRPDIITQEAIFRLQLGTRYHGHIWKGGFIDLISSALHVISNSTHTRKVHVSLQTLPSPSERVKGLAHETRAQVLLL